MDVCDCGVGRYTPERIREQEEGITLVCVGRINRHGAAGFVHRLAFAIANAQEKKNDRKKIQLSL